MHRHEASGQWFVFPYDKVRSLFADTRMSANRIAGFADAVPASMREEVARVVPYLETWPIFRDGKAHSHLRSVLHLALTRERSRRCAGRSNEPLTICSTRRANLGGSMSRRGMAHLLPVYVLADFMGVHPEDYTRVVQWSADFVDFFNIIPITEDTAYRMVKSSTEMTEHMCGLLAKRGNEGRDDFLGLMARSPRPARSPRTR